MVVGGEGRRPRDLERSFAAGQGLADAGPLAQVRGSEVRAMSGMGGLGGQAAKGEAAKAEAGRAGMRAGVPAAASKSARATMRRASSIL